MRRVVLSLIVAVTGFAQVPGTDGTQRYIVRLKDSAFARHDAEALPGFRKIHRGQHIPTVTVSATPQELKQLQAHPDVAYVTPDRPLRASSDLLAQTINATANGSAQGVWQFGANGFSGNLGQGITVAVIDSGIDSTSPDFGNAQGRLDSNNSRILYRENFLVPLQSNGQYPPQRYQTNDAYGHGTHWSGILNRTRPRLREDCSRIYGTTRTAWWPRATREAAAKTSSGTPETRFGSHPPG